MESNRKTPLWYFRLKSAAFDDPKIKAIEMLPESKYGPNFGSFVIHLYFKMLCYSIPKNGELYFFFNEMESNDIAYEISRRFCTTDKLPQVRMALSILADNQDEERNLIRLENDTGCLKMIISDVPKNTSRIQLDSERRRLRRLNLPEERQIGSSERQTIGTWKNIALSKEELLRLRENYDPLRVDAAIEIAGAKKNMINKLGRISVEDDYKLVLEILETHGWQ